MRRGPRHGLSGESSGSAAHFSLVRYQIRPLYLAYHIESSIFVLLELYSQINVIWEFVNRPIAAFLTLSELDAW